jgi:excinuclease UvrABC nuclease subunit
VLTNTLPFSAEQQNIFEQIPAAAAVFLLRGEGEPYISKTANLRRRLQRLLGTPVEPSKRLNLRHHVREIEYTPTGSDFESRFLLYQVLRKSFPKTYAPRLRLRPAPLVKLHLENEYPRASVTTRLGKVRLVAGDISDTERGGIAGVSVREEGLTDEGEDAMKVYRPPSLAPPDSRPPDAAKATPSGEAGRGCKTPHGPSNLYYGPFASRATAEKFASDALDFFKMRRCVEDLHPDPSFPGCIYSEMKMCLAPCFKGCTDAEYHAEVARVRAFFDTRGESFARQLAEQRDRASAALDFEEAAAIHAKLDKLKPLFSQLPEIVRRIDGLRAVIVQPSAEAGMVLLFLFQACALHGPVAFSAEPRAESQSMEARVEEAFAQFPMVSTHSTAERMEHLAMLKRWYYRSNRVGEIFFTDGGGPWPFRRIVRGIGRVYRGQRPQQPVTFSATQGPQTPS